METTNTREVNIEAAGGSGCRLRHTAGTGRVWIAVGGACASLDAPTVDALIAALRYWRETGQLPTSAV